MRLLARTIFMCGCAATMSMVAACSGGESASPPSAPPPPPPAAGPAASVTIQAGDNQSAEPRTAVATKPVVLLSDAAGRAVPGVSVSFTVDSGGGTVQSATATTAADGKASPGDWTLGPTEARNVISVQAGSLSARIVASARYVKTQLAEQTLSAGGGEIVVPGPSPLAGFKITVPAGAFTAGVGVRIGYESAAGIPHDSIARLASPLITIESNAPGLANELLTLRIPARLQPGEFPLVTFVDPTTGFREALYTVDFDSTGVTAEAPALTDRPLLPLDVQPAAMRARPGHQISAARAQLAQVTAQVVVQAVKYNIFLLPTVTGFTPGVDDWEFPSEATPLGPSTALGQVASSRYYYLNKKSSLGPLWGRFQRAPGVETSNSAGLYWSAGLSAALAPGIQMHFRRAVAQRQADPAKYDSLFLRSAVLSMIFSKGWPQVVAALDPATQTMNPALVYGWTGPLGRQLLIAAPYDPGVTHRLTFVSGAPNCTRPCIPVGNLNYVSHGLAQQWPSVVNETMYKDFFPPASVGRNLPGTGQPPGPSVIDTLFMVRDTGSVYTLIPSWPHQLPTGVANPSSVLMTKAWFEDSPGSTWSPSGYGASNNMEFLDAASLRISAGDPGVNRMFGVEARVVWPPNGGFPTDGWSGFKRYRLIKYVPTLTGVYAPLGQQTTLTISTAGGLPLPASYVYRVDFGDGTATTSQTRVSTVGHTYIDHVPRTARLAVIHPVTRDTVARASAPITIPPDFYFASDTVVEMPGVPVTLTLKNRSAVTPTPIRYDWIFTHFGGPQAVSVHGDSVVQHTWPGNGNFSATVTVRDAVTNGVLDQDTVQVIIYQAAWKFTNLSVNFTTTGAERRVNFGHAGIWPADSLMWVRIRNGQNEAGLLYFEKDYNFVGGTLLKGLYLLEGTNITATRLITALDHVPPAFYGQAPLAGRISSHWMLWRALTTLRTNADPNLNEGYLETGNITSGSIAGTVWNNATWNVFPPITYFPRNLYQANVTFAGETASGTLTYIYRNNNDCGGCGDPYSAELIRRVIRVSFTAQRLR